MTTPKTFQIEGADGVKYTKYEKTSTLQYNKEVMEGFEGTIKPAFPKKENGAMLYTGIQLGSKCGVPTYEGETFPVRNILKESGFVWNDTFKVWHPKGTILAIFWEYGFSM